MRVRAALLVVATAACGGGGDARRADSTRLADSVSAASNMGSGRAGDSAANPDGPSANDTARASAPPRQSVTPRPAGEQPAGKPTASFDTVRGTVLEVGSEPATMISIRSASGERISISGSQTAALRRSAGADVSASGTRDGSSMDVVSFRVRSVDGVAATDGRLVADGAGVAIMDANGTRHAIPRPPEALRAHVGKRVWVSGSLDAVNAFGVIEP